MKIPPIILYVLFHAAAVVITFWCLMVLLPTTR